MADSDALIVVGDWISEHYFTSDANRDSFRGRVLDRVKAWREAEQPTTKSRFTGERSRLATAMAALYSNGDDLDATRALYAELRRILGYEPGPYETKTDGPLRILKSPGLETSLAIVEAKPVAALDDLFVKDAPTLLTPYEVSEGDEITSATKLVSTVFLDEEPPAFALIMAGRWQIVAEASRWAEGRYLAVDLQTVAERDDTKRGGEIDRALTCLDAVSLAPDAEGDIWWSGVFEDSVKHAVGVSEDLREGVRESIEIIANEVVDRRRAQGLDPLPPEEARTLALQSLRFLYRILFLLYAEASPELEVLPVGDPDYAQGYSLDRLRELVQVEIATPQAMHGTHFYESLAVLFRLIDRGHQPHVDDDLAARGLKFEPLRADLFKPEATHLIDEVQLGNDALQQVLRRLLLSKEQKGRERGFISYVELGINQLGAVYEGLMSYTGSFADVDLYEVAPNGDARKGSWVVPVDRADHLQDKDFVKDIDPVTGQEQRRRYSRGQFVFRLSGRERQRSASYYTPEVLTKFTVSQALEELLDDDTTAEEILGLSVCEPALGSGAFAIEAVRQLADEYLKRRQRELGERIDPEEYANELQRVKAYIALHNVYGVDLNATAVEFAEITLWLDTMAAGLAAPWFGLRLRRGNSLVGASRSTYSTGDVEKKRWLKQAPTAKPMTEIAERVAEDRIHEGFDGHIHHWLLPAEGWGATSQSKEAKNLAPERTKRVNAWRRSVRGKPTKKQIDRLQRIAQQAEVLWALAYKRLTVAEQESTREIPLWGRTGEQALAAGSSRSSTAEPARIAGDAGSLLVKRRLSDGDSSPSLERQRTGESSLHSMVDQPRRGTGLGTGGTTPTVTREQIEDSLADENGAYRRLRRMMDAWCALWYWPLTGDEVEPPTLDHWIDAAEGILGAHHVSRRANPHAATLSPSNAWEALADQETFELASGGARPVRDVLDDHPWLGVCEDVGDEQGFFHWELDFATVMGRGGFDLQVGNPPWVRPDADVDALLAEADPWWQLTNKPSEMLKKKRRLETLSVPGAVETLIDGETEVLALREFVSDPGTYPVLEGLRPDLYRCFVAHTWGNASARGVIGLLHPETHFTDEKAGVLRSETYPRLRRHWQFVNELQLFDEVHHLVSYGVHVYGSPRSVDFLNASGLYHPDTIERSFRHDGSGEEPGLKHDGYWDMRPHAARLQRVDDGVLETWRDVLESPDSPASQARMLYTVNRSSALVMDRLAHAPRVGSLGLQFSQGWNETTDRQKGRFIQQWGPVESWDDAILQGPHLHVANPFYKSPNSTMKHNQDWSAIDLETLAPDALPVTSYKPAGDRAVYDASYGMWNGTPVRDHYRVLWRAMAANSGERTLIPALVPPGPTHVHTVSGAGSGSNRDLILLAGVLSSLLADFGVRAAPKSALTYDVLGRLPLPPTEHPLISRLRLRAMRLNCLTDAYADLWREVWDPVFAEDEWLLEPAYPEAPRLGDVGPRWSAAVPLRRDLDRRNALVEIDVLMAKMLGITADELATIYRTQFAVLHGYDQSTYYFDANGRIVPNGVLTVWRRKGDAITEMERTATHPAGTVYTYELPFATRDRETDFHEAMRALEEVD